MNREEIIKLVLDNHLELEVYEALHRIILSELNNLHYKLKESKSELTLIRKFSDANKMDVIKTILQVESEE